MYLRGGRTDDKGKKVRVDVVHCQPITKRKRVGSPRRGEGAASAVWPKLRGGGEQGIRDSGGPGNYPCPRVKISQIRASMRLA